MLSLVELLFSTFTITHLLNYYIKYFFKCHGVSVCLNNLFLRRKYS